MGVRYGPQYINASVAKVPASLVGSCRTIRSLVEHDVNVFIFDAAMAFTYLWPSPSSHPNPHGQAREFLRKIQSMIHDWTSRDSRSTKFIVFFDHPRFRPELKRATVEGRLKKRTTSVLSASPIPVISEDAFNKAFPTAQPWEEDFEGQGRKVELGKIASKGDVSFVLAAHETDPIIAAATKFGSIGGVELVSERTALVSGDSDYAMLLSASLAKYRILPRSKRTADDSMLDSDGRFVLSFLFGNDYFGGVKGWGFKAPIKVPIDNPLFQLNTFLRDNDHAHGRLARGPPINAPALSTDDIRELCDHIRAVRQLYLFASDALFDKNELVDDPTANLSADAARRAITAAGGSNVRFSKEKLFDKVAKIERVSPLLPSAFPRNANPKHGGHHSISDTKAKFDTKVATRCEHNFARESKKPARTMSAPSCADPLRREPVVSTSNKAKQNATPESAPHQFEEAYGHEKLLALTSTKQGLTLRLRRASLRSLRLLGLTTDRFGTP
ncbi:BQ5605_C001g00388 [Microbotryum silenes-dioicae]|uniref:BQ5605_C001g00388 protein n=1 Tax=Microbotryum silenes-dioicae TaxID=796604 RepID=A0A2X0M767_9BASI|nr:BQ5605_C001g00388 [Microbotryum silenes-dioicae]